MEVSPQVEEMSGQLAQAVKTTLDPTVPHAARSAAYTLLEKAKDDSGVAVGCGLVLARREGEALVRHLGLQLLEHTIKYKWNDLQVQQKVYIKENIMQLLGDGTLDLMTEQLYVKDKVSRLVVEMMKREWPQQWPTLLDELHLVSRRGPTQAELVLLVFLRVAEDVATLQNLESSQRRRDLYQAMTANMDSIFGFFLALLEENYSGSKSAAGTTQAQHHCRVMQVVLMTLTVYVEWVAVQHIFTGDGKLLRSLCFLLSEDSVKMEAAECLLQIVSRKGKMEERAPLLVLFAREPVAAIFQAAERAVRGPLSEPNYRFLKTLTQVLTGLGAQLCALWGKDGDVGEPPNLRVYLDAVLAFTGHPSLAIYKYTCGLWTQLFRHDQLAATAALAALVPFWLTIAMRKVIKHGYPSKNDSESCQYSRMDFDSDEDYSLFFHKVRCDTLECLKAACAVAPQPLYSYAEGWFRSQVAKPPPAEMCTQFTPFYLELEAISQVLECVIGRVMQGEHGFTPSPEHGQELLQLCLTYQTNDPLILSALLSCISGLFVFIRRVPGVLPEVLNKIFAALTFSLPGQTKDTRSRTVKNVRRHGCGLMVKIAKEYSDILLPSFDFISGVVDRLIQNPVELSQLEKVTLLESVIIISNQFHNFDKQSELIGKVLLQVSEIWLSLKQPFSSPIEFMSFIGLDKAPAEPSGNDVNGQNRAQITFCSNLILAVLRRAEFPSDPDVAERGGFVLERSEGGGVLCRNPATPHVTPLLHQLFCLLRLFNALWQPDALARVSPGYAKAHNLTEVEKNNILGLSNLNVVDSCVEAPKQPLERMQHFLSIVHDNCYHVLGHACMALGPPLYHHPHLPEYVIHSALANLHLVPDYRLRPVTRSFLKPLVKSCPASCHATVLLPILRHLCPYMLERLSLRWSQLSSLIESGRYEEDATDTQEMLDDQLTRLLTRDYVELLKLVLMARGSAGLDAMDGAMEADMEAAVPVITGQETLSDLGQLVLACDVICQAIVTLLLKVLWWQDSAACLKAVAVVGLVVRWLVGEGQHLSPEAVKQVLVAVLQGLHQHGQHEANQSALLSLGLSTYEMFRPHFPHVQEVLLGLPGVNAEDVHKFDEKILNANQSARSNKVEKMKKDMFKKLVSEVVGRSMGEAFRKKVHMANLPPMFRAPRPKQPRLDDTDNDIGLCSLFGPDAEANGHGLVMQ